MNISRLAGHDQDDPPSLVGRAERRCDAGWARHRPARQQRRDAAATAACAACASAFREPHAATVIGGWKCTATVVVPSPAMRHRCDARTMSPYQAKNGPERAPDRNAVEPRIGDRHRLDRERPAVDLEVGEAQQSALEAQRPIAVAAGALGEQDQIAAGARRWRIKAPWLAVAVRWRLTNTVLCSLASSRTAASPRPPPWRRTSRRSASRAR